MCKSQSKNNDGIDEIGQIYFSIFRDYFGRHCFAARTQFYHKRPVEESGSFHQSFFQTPGGRVMSGLKDGRACLAARLARERGRGRQPRKPYP